MNETAARWLFNEMWGFKTLPPTTDYVTYAKALLTCAKGDGHLDARERDWVVGYLSSLGASSEVLDLARSYDEEVEIATIVKESAALNRAESKANLLFDAIRASAADGELHENEVAEIAKMATVLGVRKEVVPQLVAAYHAEAAAKRARLALIFPNGAPF